MFESWGGRIVAVAGLLGVLFVLLIGFGSVGPAPDLGAYPDENDLAADYDGYRGEPVHVGGTVVETDPVVVEAEYDYYAAGTRNRGEITFTVRGVDRSVSPGQFLQVFGTAGPDRTIAARRVVGVPSRNFAYMFTVSFLAGLWVLARLVRGWRLDRTDGALRRRDASVTTGDTDDSEPTEGSD